MSAQVLAVLEQRFRASVRALGSGERDRLFAVVPVLEEHYRGGKENGLPEEPVRKMISQNLPNLV